MSIGQVSAPDTTPPPFPAASPAPAGTATGATVQIISQPVISVPPTRQNTAVDNAETDKQLLQQSISNLNAHLKNVGNNSVEFSINSSTGQVVVQVVDTQTQTILMQTPSKQAIAIAQAQLQAQDNPRGLLIKTKA